MSALILTAPDAMTVEAIETELSALEWTHEVYEQDGQYDFNFSWTDRCRWNELVAELDRREGVAA